METEPRERTEPPSPAGGASAAARLGWIVTLGVLAGIGLRLWEFADLRSLYMDESALLSNLVGVPVFEFGQVLKQDQLAPPGYLVVERLLVRLPARVEASGRLVALACGLGTMLMAAPLARRYLVGIGVPFAVWTLALSDHLIYYSAEIKPYMCDLAGAMATLLLAVPPDESPPSRRRLIALTAWGAVAPWFSFPVVFVLAGVGFHLIARCWASNGRRGLAAGVAVCGAWFVSFLGCFLLSRAIVTKGDFLWTWWNFAFLPIPPRSWADAQFTAETVANVFTNPGSILTPFGLIPTTLLASALAIPGLVSLGRRWRGGLFVVAAPLVFHLSASALHQYPFHGRLILSLVPTYHLALAEGVWLVGRMTRTWCAVLVAAVFLLGQAGDIFWNQVVLPKSRFRPFDTHGDLKDDFLDALYYLRNPNPNLNRSGTNPPPTQAESPVPPPSPDADAR